MVCTLVIVECLLKLNICVRHGCVALKSRRQFLWKQPFANNVTERLAQVSSHIGILASNCKITRGNVCSKHECTFGSTFICWPIIWSRYIFFQTVWFVS